MTETYIPPLDERMTALEDAAKQFMADYQRVEGRMTPDDRLAALYSFQAAQHRLAQASRRRSLRFLAGDIQAAGDAIAEASALLPR